MARKRTLVQVATSACFILGFCFLAVLIASCSYLDWHDASKTPVAARLFLSSGFSLCGMISLVGMFSALADGCVSWPSRRSIWRLAGIDKISRKDEPGRFWRCVLLLGLTGLGGLIGGVLALLFDLSGSGSMG